MKNSIETIWKEGFLNEKSLVAPKVNDLYNRKSKHVVERIKRMFRVNLRIIIVSSIVIPIVYYFIDAIWQGVAASVLLLLTAWYGNRQLRTIKTLDHGTNSLDYLRSFDRWLNDVLLSSVKVVRFSYPLYFLIAISTVWSTLSKKQEMILNVRQQFPDSVFVGDIPLFALIVVGAITLLMFYFSDKIYRWDMRLMYGCVFDKLKVTISEIEKLKQE